MTNKIKRRIFIAIFSTSILVNILLLTNKYTELIAIEDTSLKVINLDGNSSNELNPEDSISSEHQYINLEKLLGVLNQEMIVGSKLVDNYIFIGQAAMPLYEIEEPYTYSTTADSGEIVAVSKYIEGTYDLGDGIQVKNIIVQDKTFENGGFIYISEKGEELYNTFLYKFKNSYVIFQVYGNNVDYIKLNVFIKNIIGILETNYEELDAS